MCPEVHYNRDNGQKTDPSDSTVHKEQSRLGEHLRAEVPDLAYDPDLMHTIEKDIAALGVVGEKESAKLVYLAGTSRKLPNPLRVILRGPSSVGKTLVQRKVVSLFPPKDVVDATSLTPQALYYGKPGWLKHKFVIKGERGFRNDEQGQDSTAALRQMISENRITKVVTQMEKGRLKTFTITQEGPIAFTETTTQKSIFAEDLNRCLSVFADESAKQTWNVTHAVADGYLPDVPKAVPQAVMERHRKFQAALQKADDRIPYAKQLADWLPTKKLQARRVITQLLATIETVTFLYQYQRERNNHGQLLATPEDYAIARRLLMGPLSESLGCGNEVWNAFEQLRNRFPDRFTSTDALKLFTNKMTTHRRLKELTDHGALQQLAEGKGQKPATWGWTGKGLRPVLPPDVS
jgi:hypothetical protein